MLIPGGAPHRGPGGVGADRAQPGRHGGRRRVLTGDSPGSHHARCIVPYPYRDFSVQYPPLMLGAIRCSTVGRSLATVATMWSQQQLDLIIAALIAWGWGRRGALSRISSSGCRSCSTPLSLSSRSTCSVALAVGGLALLRRRRPALGAAALALTTASARCGRCYWRRACWFDGRGGPSLHTGPEGHRHGSLGGLGRYRQARSGAVDAGRDGLGSRKRGCRRAGGHPRPGPHRPRRVAGRGHARVGQPGPHAVLLFATRWSPAGFSRTGTVPTAPESSTAPHGAAPCGRVLPSLSPLLSPQFLLWLVPFAAIVTARGLGDRSAHAVVVGAQRRGPQRHPGSGARQ